MRGGAARTLHAVRVARRGEAPVQAPVQAPVHVPLHTLQPGDRTCRDRDRDKSPACACSSAMALVMKSNVPAIRHYYNYGLYETTFGLRSQSVSLITVLRACLSTGLYTGPARAGRGAQQMQSRITREYSREIANTLYAGSAPGRRAGQQAQHQQPRGSSVRRK